MLSKKRHLGYVEPNEEPRSRDLVFLHRCKKTAKKSGISVLCFNWLRALRKDPIRGGEAGEVGCRGAFAGRIVCEGRS